ncbi:MAG: hypothetical protein Q9201_004521 [Fulgogasparrea decipioides]
MTKCSAGVDSRSKSPAVHRQNTTLPPDLYAMGLRNLIRSQYRWTLPRESHCAQHIPALPSGRALIVTTDHEHEALLNKQRLRDISSFKLRFDKTTYAYSLDTGGKEYPYRGQGPIWDQNSCHLDCCIVAARILNVGLTAADSGSKPRASWLQSLESVPQKFFDLASNDWESLDRQTNVDRRHHFWDNDLPQLIEGNPNRPHFAPASQVWELCTSQMGQFSFLARESLSGCHHCGATPVPKSFSSHQSLSLDVARSQVDELERQLGPRPSIAQLISRELGPSQKRCGKCRAPDGRTRWREILDDLPPRLVVVPGEVTQELLFQATSDDVRFRYLSAGGEVQAVYRWLGGIYHSKHHFRLYWIDDAEEYTKSPTSHVKIYDGMCASGAIIGGIAVPASQRDEKVPRHWSRGSVVLFYERLDKAALVKAADTVKADLDIILGLEVAGASVRDYDYHNPKVPHSHNHQEAEKEDAAANRKVANNHASPVKQGDEAKGSAKADHTTKGKLDRQRAQSPASNSGQQDDTDHDSLFNDDEYQPVIDPSDDGGNTPGEDGGSQEQKRKDEDDGKKDANVSTSKDRSSTDNQKENSNCPGKLPHRSPSRSPPLSPKPPETPPSKQDILFSRISPSRLLNYLLPTPSPPPEEQLEQQQQPPPLPPRAGPSRHNGGNDDDFIYTPQITPSLSAGEESSPPELSEGLVSPPQLRRSARISKKSRDSRTSQKKLPKVQEAGTLRFPKASPKLNVQAARTGDSRGRNTVRMQSVSVARKRTRHMSPTRLKNQQKNNNVGGARPTKRLRFARAVDD